MLQVQLKERSSSKTQKDLLRRLQELDDSEVEIGWFDSSMHHSGMTDATLAYVLEYGNNDSRTEVNWEPFHFMSISAEHGRRNKRLDGVIRKGLQQHLTNKSYVDEFMFDIGQTFQSIIQNVMGDNTKLRSNSDYTIDTKEGRDTPTVDSGDLRDSLKVRVK